MEVRGVWSGVDSSSSFSLHRLHRHGGPGVRVSQSWLGRHDSTFRPNPHAVVGYDGDGKRKVIERERDMRKRAGERESVKGYCWDVQASPDALVPYNIPIPLQQKDAAFLRERNPDFSLETQYLHHTNRRMRRESDTDLEYNSFFLSCSAILMFLSLSLLSQNEVFQGPSHWQIKKTYPIL